MPKNLSLPSGRTGPAFCSIRSSGVNSGEASCFLESGLLEERPVETCVLRRRQQMRSVHRNCAARDEARIDGSGDSIAYMELWGLTDVAPLILLKMPAIASGGRECKQSRGSSGRARFGLTCKEQAVEQSC